MTGEQVVRRWLQDLPGRKRLAPEWRPRQPCEADIAQTLRDPKRVAILHAHMGNVSQFMACLNLAPAIFSYAATLNVINLRIATADPKSGRQFPDPAGEAPAGQAGLRIGSLILGGYAEWLGLLPGDLIVSYAAVTPRDKRHLDELIQANLRALAVPLVLVRGAQRYALQVAPQDLGLSVQAKLPAPASKAPVPPPREEF